MANKTIEHSFRKISFDTSNVISFTSDDEELLAAYLKLHDAAIEQTEEVRTKLDEVKEIISAASKLTDIISSAVINQKEALLTELSTHSEKVNEKIREYHTHLEDLYAQIHTLEEMINTFEEREEDLTLHDEFQDIQSKHYNNYENNSIDIVSFDDEENRFRDYLSFREKHHTSIISFADETINRYKLLSAETTAQYDLWAELFKRILLLQQLIEPISALTGPCFN